MTIINGEQITVHDEVDKFRAAATDGLLLRSGAELSAPADGAKDLRGMRMRDLAVECLKREGVTDAQRMNDEDLYSRSLSGGFLSILSDTANKSMAKAYQSVPSTYQLWTGTGSNPNFKATTHYQISEAGDLVKMAQTSEFKFDEIQDAGVTKVLATYGIGWKFTRESLINDDIGLLTRIPQAYVKSAKRGINKLVYQLLGNNEIIYDNKPLFHSDHANIDSSLLNSGALGNMRKLMRTQKNLRGIEKLNIIPKYLIVPEALESIARTLILSPADISANNSGVTNIFKNSMELIVEPELDAYSVTTFYGAANPADCDTVEVTLLNGKDTPTLDSQVDFNTLTVKWRMYIDYGVTALDYRGLVRNAGI